MNTSGIKRINVLDFAIVMLIIFFVGFCYVSVHNRQLKMHGIPEQTAYINVITSQENAPVIDKPCYFSKDGSVMGKITNARSVFAKQLTTDEHGSIIESNTNVKAGKNIRIKTSVKRDETGTYISAKTFVAPGQTVSFYDFDGNLFVGTVNSVDISS